jgi:hypothetical protein
MGGKKTKQVELDDEDDDFYLREEVEKSSDADVFAPVIKKISTSQSPAVKAAIEGTPCFAKVWYSQEDEDYCPEMECGLRKLCEAAYHQALGSVDADMEVAEELEGVKTSEIGKLMHLIEGKDDVQEDDLVKVQQSRKLQGKKSKRAAQVKNLSESERVKRSRVHYIDQGRHIDALAAILETNLQPVELPEGMYFTVKTLELRQIAAKKFVSKHGTGMCYSRSPSYHIYFYNGMHVLRLWMNAAGVGLMDLNPILAEEIEKEGLLRVTVTPIKSPRCNYNFFPKRTKIKTRYQMEVVIAAIKATLSKMVVQ